MDRPERNELLQEYYNRRAPEYEKMWYRNDPARQAEQATIVERLREMFRDRTVLEVACGTGFWTQAVAEVATKIFAVDSAPEMLALARRKGLDPARVDFQLGDAYSLESVPMGFSGGLANFWFSHVPRSRQEEFFAKFHDKLTPGAVVFMADNVFVPGLGGDLVALPGETDTFKKRLLADGSEYLVLKNYFSREDLQRIFEPHGHLREVHVGNSFWWVRYEKRI